MYRATIQAVLLGGNTVDKWYEQNGRLKDILDKLAPHAYLIPADEKSLETATYPTGEKIPADSLDKAREACKWLSMLARMKRKKDKKKLGYDKMTDFYTDVIFVIEQQGLALPTAYSKLREKVREYLSVGPECCIDKRGQANKNASKVYTEEQVSLLRSLMSRGANYGAQEITNLYNTIANAKGWDTICVRTVSNYMREYHLVIEAGRHGSEAFRNRVSMQVRRKRPTEALSFWSIDGWTAELYYQKSATDKHGRTVTTYNNRLTVVVVLDASCDYPVGFAIADNESTQLIQMAVKNAIDHCHSLFGDYYRPYQIQSDHYGIKRMTSFYSDLAEYFTPARVKNAKAKPIERYFLRLNRKYCQGMFGNQNWSGFGITSNKRSQPNIDMLNANKRRFPDRDGVISQINYIINQERRLKQGIFREAWKRMPEEDRLDMTREEYLYKFGVRNERTRRLKAGCFEPTILGIQRSYDTYDIDFRKDPLCSWTVIYDDNDLGTILVTDHTEKRRFLLEEVHRQPMALRDRGKGDFEALRKIDEYNKKVLEPYVINTVATDEENVKKLLDDIGQIDTKQAYTPLTDSMGQHKNYLQPGRLIKSEEDLAAEAEEKERDLMQKKTRAVQKKGASSLKKEQEQSYEEYALKKIGDLNKFK